MRHLKLYTVIALLGGLVLAVGSASYAEYAVCSTARSLFHVPHNLVLFCTQVLPYLLCAALWLPWRSPTAAKAGAIISGLLFGATVLLYILMLQGHNAAALCEMGGAAVGIISMAGSIALVLISLVVLLILLSSNRVTAR